MATTLLQARNELRAYLNEVSPRYWTDAMLNTFINEGQRDISRRAECLLTITSPLVTAGQQDYDCLPETIRIHRVEFVVGSQVYPLRAATLAEMDQYWGVQQQVTQGYPQFWTTRLSPPNLKLRLWPVPSTTALLNIHFYRLAFDLTADGQSIDVPDGWYDLIVNYAEYCAKRRDNDPTWKEAKDLYEEKLNNMIEVTRDYRDEAGMMVSPGGLSIPSWLYEGGW